MRNGIMPEQIDNLTLEQMALLVQADTDDEIDGNALLLHSDPAIARSFALAEGFVLTGE